MPIILDTKHFIVEAHDQPHHHRDNGGHVKVSPKEKFTDRTQMPTDHYLDLMQLVQVTGKAITTVMRRKGVDVVKINYQDNGNWPYFPSISKKPQIHVHLYVRTSQEKHPDGDQRFRAFPNALVFPFIDDHPDYYQSFQPYSEEDCTDIRAEIERLLETEEHRELKLHL